MSKKSTNFELLRILLTIFIPIYHWLLYNGIFYAENSSNNLCSLALFSGIPFSCLYAFIAMSSYFFVKKKYNWNARKLYSFLALIITLLIFKNILIHGLFPGEKMNYYVDTFFIHGAWWYVYPYILIMICYPLLNYFIYHVSMKTLYFVTGIWGALFVMNIITNNTNMQNDCIMFGLIYFIMGCIERQKENKSPSLFYQKHQKQIILIIYFIAVSSAAILSVYLKHPATNLPLETANVILQKVHGRYTLAGLISGIAIFTFFKNLHVPYHSMIHKLSKYTLFVFLLHESVMCVFWYFEIKSCEFLAFLPASVFWGLLFLYLILCILTAVILHNIYAAFIEPLWNKLIDKLCASSLTTKWEAAYKKLDRRTNDV